MRSVRQGDHEPFDAALRRGGDETGRRQAQRRAQWMISQATRLGFSELANWISEGFRSGELTDDGADGDPASVARTLAAARLFGFVENAAAGRATQGSATLVFEPSQPHRRREAPVVTRHDLRDMPPGELHGTLLAAAFGASRTAVIYHLRHFNIDELAPEPESAAGLPTLDAWEALPRQPLRPLLLTGPAEYRVRFGWSDRAGDVRLARLAQKLHLESVDGAGAVQPRLRLEGPPVLTPRSDSRLACDRWDRLLLDGFMANQLTTYLMQRAR